MVGHGVGGHSDDRRLGSPGYLFLLTNNTTGFHTTHNGHLHVHQNNVPGLAFPSLHSELAIFDHSQGDAKLLHQGAEHQLIDQIILGCQDAKALHDLLRGDRLFIIDDPQRLSGVTQTRNLQEGREGRALAQLTLYPNIAAHQLGKVPRNTQP